MIEYLSEFITLLLIAVIAGFAGMIVKKMDEIHRDISDLAINHGERLARLETKVCRQ